LNEIYLDNSATTPPYPSVIELMGRIEQDYYGNPSSMHLKGINAEKEISGARRRIAALFGSREKEIIFTSGGTEANNLAIKGAAYRNRRRGNHIITTSVEHPSVLKCFNFLEQEGFRASYLPVDSRGVVDPDDLKSLVGKETILVSVMHVNNEVGSIQPLEEIGRVIRAANPAVLFHVDAVQSFTRLPLEINKWHADMVSCSAHKIHGPKGAGCLRVRKNLVLQPLLHGGLQEAGLRAGTENTAAIAGFGLAAGLSGDNMSGKSLNLKRLKILFYQELQNSGVYFKLNGPAPEEGAPHIINLSFPGVKAEVLMRRLETANIFVSPGSACHSRRPEPSHVLKAMGQANSDIESALRFSFSILNSEDEVRFAAKATADAAKEFTTVKK
jgi:cysteine desulfurase